MFLIFFVSWRLSDSSEKLRVQIIEGFEDLGSLGRNSAVGIRQVFVFMAVY